jgi:hypothetical protein
VDVRGGWGGAESRSNRPLTHTTPPPFTLRRPLPQYFAWDCAICLLDGFGAAFIFHGVACLLVFTVALTPFMHYMAYVALLFEASTPLLHARRMLIMAGATEGRLYSATQAAFAAVFFAVRIAFGWVSCAVWFARMAREIAPGGVAHPQAPLMLLYAVLCGGLSLLNGVWMREMLVVAFGGGKPAVKRKGA